jgi:DNA invertase Pin-like site-specific DNA recombinase
MSPSFDFPPYRGLNAYFSTGRNARYTINRTLDMVIGCIRVSKTEQNQDLKFDSLKKAGCEKIYHEKIFGASLQRPGYIRMISELRKGEVIIVWGIDRLGRTTYELIKLISCSERNGCGLPEYF